MKRLLALLLLTISPAFAQEIVPGPYLPPPPPQIDGETGNIVYTTLNPPPSGTSYSWTGFINTQSNGGGLSGGNVPGYNPSTGTFLFGYAQGTVTYNLFDSPDWPNPGTMFNGFKYSWEYFNQDFSRGNISANIRVFDLNNITLENYFFGMPQTTNGWTMMSGQIDFSMPYDIANIGGFELSFTGKDDRFWAGYYGPQVRAIDVSALYTIPPPAPYSPEFLYWNNLTGEGGLFTLTETTSVRYGAEGTYVYALLQAGTYECSNGAWGIDPIGGVVKSCEAGTDTAPLADVVDCALNPTDPTCIINSLVDTDGVVDPVDQAIADATTTDTSTEETGSDDGSSDGTEVAEEEEEEVLVAEETVTEETNLQELLQDEEVTEEDVVVAETTTETAAVVEAVAAISRELTDEEKAAILADAISKNTLEGALSIAADATAAASNTSGTTTTSDSSTSTKTTAAASASEFTIVAQETSSSQFTSEEAKQETSESSSSGLDILETGRQMGAAALATILTDSASSASDSMTQAESVASTSSESSFTSADVMQVRTDTVAADIVIEVDTSTTNIDTSIATEDANSITAVASNDTSSVSEQIDSFSDIMQIDIRPETGEVKDADLEFVQQLAAASEQKQDETNNSGFSEEEKVTIANDPALANAFNVSPNITNLEVAGVLGGKQEEKSDAEKRADEVVASNAKEQEEINKNYMDADQSGIVAAMGADTDVSAYRTAMLRDNNVWYKPEDIYKNIVIKDNVRGSYFLEKGNTDTFKKMVEEQYK